jgi:very-short-patch-repair endonuclease
MMPWKQSPSKLITPAAKINARKLRRSMTDGERQLWRYLRADFAGPDTHFRRQVAIGQYVADFCCLKHRLIVEVDGEIHPTDAAKACDAVRTDFLRRNGYRVVRVSNRQVTVDIRSALDQIAAELGGTTPTPNPSPQGGGESRPVSS